MMGWDYSNFTKGETFLVSLKLSAIWGNLTSHYSCLLLPKKSSFLQFGQAENVHAGADLGLLQYPRWSKTISYYHKTLHLEC